MSTTGTLGFESAAELARRIRTKAVSSLELTRYFIARIERLDDAVRAIAVRDFDRALEAARAADDALARGEAIGPLHGLPITVKEAHDVAGLPTTWGVPAYRDNVAAADAEVVARLKAAGALLLGKSNVPVMLGDFQSCNELFGATQNPWDRARTPGGSSGGAAAALAAGLTALESGSDLGGSIRAPAHYCGVYGHKPTWGIVPPRGHALPPVPPAPDMAVLGPLARSAEDLALALGAIAGADPQDAAGWRLALPPPRATQLRGLRLAVWPTEAVAPVDAEIADRVQHVADALARRGATVSDRARPGFGAAAYRRTYAALVSSLMGATVPDAVYEETRRRVAALGPADPEHPENEPRPVAAARALVLDHRAWLRHDAERARLRAEWARFFADWDVLVCPVMATAAFPHDHRPLEARTLTVNGAEQPYFDQVFWSGLASLAYLPATAFPTGPSRAGLPIGLQAIGPAFGDHTTIEFARLLADELGGFVPPPGFAD